MRNPCWDCTRKHLAQASILLDETHLGYPHYRWLAVGHMAEAESEIMSTNLDFAKMVRELRCQIMMSFDASFKACIEDLIILACFLAGEDDLTKHSTGYSSKKFKVIEDWEATHDLQVEP